jgi:2-keto-4-pentenoate hydratase
MTPQQISSAFRAARLTATSLDSYPAQSAPPDLDTAYQIQEAGISAWPDSVLGWKVAVIQPVWRDRYASERLAGPIFSKTIWDASSQVASVPVIENGYAAVEAEFAIRIARSVPVSEPIIDPEQLLPYIEGVYAALELAASPLATLNALGPGAVISDFGNNSGLVVGAKLPDGLLSDPSSASSTVEINGEVAGHGSAARVPGGPLSALMFLVNHLASRGRTLKEGDWVSTGASTGIHLVKTGDRVTALFNGEVRLSATICVARAQSS